MLRFGFGMKALVRRRGIYISLYQSLIYNISWCMVAYTFCLKTSQIAVEEATFIVRGEFAFVCSAKMPCGCPCDRNTPHDQCASRENNYQRCNCSSCGHSKCHVRVRKGKTYCWVCEGTWQPDADPDADNADKKREDHEPKDEGKGKRKRKRKDISGNTDPAGDMNVKTSEIGSL
jgi:hypothetical protein